VARLAPGDAFAVLLVHQSPERAQLALARLTAAIERHVFPQRRRVAVQAAIAGWPADGEDAAGLLARAGASAAAPTVLPEAA
jgi:GGDEF domain-containing protein